MLDFKCPVCGSVLHREDRTMRCSSGHCYDLAKQGYVNLLMSNRSSAKRHGDDKQMVLARQSFLEKGYYDCLRDAVCSLAVRRCGSQVDLLDVGCGEGWYTCGVKTALERAGATCRATGVDISREALIQAAKRGCGLQLAVGSVSALPVLDSSCDLLLNIFAPNSDDEFFRVLRPGGVLIRAVPLEEHLMGLKAAIYDRPYANPAPQYTPEGFRLLERVDVRDRLTLESNEDIQDLFMMTPYYYKTGRQDQEKLQTLDALETELAFCLFVHERI